MIKLKLIKNKINEKSNVNILIDPHIALWLKIGIDRESVNSYYIHGRNDGILTISGDCQSKKICEIILVLSKEIEYSSELLTARHYYSLTS